MIEKLFRNLILHGYRCFIIDDSRYNYGYIFTPSNNVMYVDWAPYRGFHVSLEYVPTRSNGSGCSVKDEISELDIDLLKQLEKDCELYAGTLGAQMYTSPKEWYSKYWNKDNLVEITQ